jgi:hypothetical protein
MYAGTRLRVLAVQSPLVGVCAVGIFLSQGGMAALSIIRKTLGLALPLIATAIEHRMYPCKPSTANLHKKLRLGY